MARKLTDNQRATITRTRERLQLSRAELARLAGVSYGALAAIESGKTVRPRGGVFEKIRTALEEQTRTQRESGAQDGPERAAISSGATTAAPESPISSPAKSGKGDRAAPASSLDATAPEDTPDVIAVTARPHEYHVYLKAQPEKHAVGLSLAEAIGNLILANQRWFWIELEMSEAPVRRSGPRGR